ncbi:MAG: ABC transporter substrate-binding protein [Microthrixaceae bacterium]|nr:ABC transporter substrate-binding protein [Microthrixaceae bacterium]
MNRSGSESRASILVVAIVATCSILLSACGGTKGSTTGKSTETEPSEPQYGGNVIYGIAAENADGWCLSEAQLAPPGIQVARSIYDTLTIPNEDGELVPFLAKSLTPNDDFTEWTMELREGIKFHDGTALDSTVVKNNVDAYRGAYPARHPLLFSFVFDNIADVEVTGPMTLKLTTIAPWSSLPQVLWSTGRTGIMAQAQLDDPDTCDTKLIGTGPFELVEWAQNERLVLKRNESYWQRDASGNQLPYLDGLEYRPAPDAGSRTNSLLAGELNAMTTASAQQMAVLKDAESNGKVTNVLSDEFPTVAFIQLNNSIPPFNNKNARLAVISALDMETFNQTINLGELKIANGPFAPGNIGYLKDTGYPTFNLDQAKKYLDAYTSETGESLKFSIVSPSDQPTVSAMTLVQEMLKKAGIAVTVTPMEIAAMISTAVSGNYTGMAFANFPGGDPDDNRVWWYGASPVNLSKFNDAEINRLLDEGRASGDPETRQRVYSEINRRFASEGYSVWLNWVLTDVATAPNVHGVFGAKLPNGDDPSRALANGHSTAGLWIDQNTSGS